MVIFFIISLLLIFSAVGVVVSKNPVHSIFFLILVFMLGSSLFFFLNLEFLAFIFIIIYVGAIAVLFLFIIMMLNVKLVELNSFFYNYLPVGVFIIITFFLEFFFYIKFSINLKITDYIFYSDVLDYLYSFSTLELLAFVLYNFYFLGFIFCSFILFLATIASVALTLKGTTLIKYTSLNKLKKDSKFSLRSQKFYDQYIQSYEKRIYFN